MAVASEFWVPDKLRCEFIEIMLVLTDKAMF